MTHEELIHANNPLIEFDAAGMPIAPTFILCNRDCSYIGTVTNVARHTEANYMNSPDEISFSVAKVVDGKVCGVWESIKDFKLIYVPRKNEWYEITVNVDEDNETIKSVHGIHAQEAELSQRLVFETEINTEEDIAREDYVVTKFYDPDNPAGSLLDRLLADKCQDYSIYHVDSSLQNVQRMFSFNRKSVKDCLDEIADEVECLFIYGESQNDDGQIHRTISAYDLLDYCASCNERGSFSNGVCTYCGSTSIIPGYGEDTNIFVSHENIASSVTLQSNADKVKNCFRLQAGDDVMTAVVRSINPSSSQYVWYFTDDMRADMSTALRTRLTEYDTLYDEYQNTYNMSIIPSDLVTSYNTLVDKYDDYAEGLSPITYPIRGTTNLVSADYKARYMYDLLNTTMAPGSSDVTDTTAAEQVEELEENLTTIGVGADKDLDNLSLSTANSAVTTYAKLWVDTSRYKVSIASSSYSNPTWQGIITVASYTDDTDIASTTTLSLTFTTASATYIQQSIDKAMSKMEAQNLGTVALFHKSEAEFEAELVKYSLSNLEIIRDACSACLDIMIEQGIAETDEDLYSQLYYPYFVKSGLIEDELILREAEIAVLLAPDKDADYGLIDYIEKQREEVRTALDMYDFIGDQLWQELMSFRRDDVYENSNFISDGLTDAELIENAQDFYKAAMKEIVKSATLQNTLSGKLQNFLIMPEFQNIASYVSLGNKIYLSIDDKVYQLRLISYEIDYDKIDDIDIDFSDVVRAGDIVTDTRSILDQARSMATSYDAVTRKAEKGNKANQYYTNIATRGLDLTTTKIVNSADNQNMVQDQFGLLMRRKDDFDDGYGLEQVKIINRGLYYTKDAWQTASAGIGHFKYIDPDDGTEKDGYGVIADKVIGNLILGNDIRIYSPNNAVTINEDGAIFTLMDDENTGLFKIRKKNDDNSYTDIMYVNADGKMVINSADIEVNTGASLDEYVRDSIDIGGTNYISESSVGEESFTAYGVEITYTTEGWWRAYGTLPTYYGGYSNVLYSDVNVIPGEQYTISVENELYDGDSLDRDIAVVYNESSEDVIVTDTVLSYLGTFTVPDNITRVNIVIFNDERYSTRTQTIDYRFRLKLEKGNKSTSWSPCPTDVNEAIVNAEEESKSYTDTTISNEISALEGIYVKEDGINLRFKSAIENNETIVGLVSDTATNKTNTDTIYRYINFVNGNIELKTSQADAIRLLIQNDRISFYQDNTEVAYISNNKLYIKEAEILADSNKQGKLTLGNFAFIPQTNGSLSFRKVK